MNCKGVEAVLLDFIEGGLDEREAQAVRSHIKGCPACKLNLQETRELIGVLEDAKRQQDRSRRTGQRGDTSSEAVVGVIGWRAGEVLGDFKILGEIGRGGMGVVYRANQVSLNRIVALKVLAGMVCQTKKAITRFKKEARAAAKLHHTNIVPVYAQGEHEGHYYYAMELVDGKGLNLVLQDNPSMIVPSLSEEPPSDSLAETQEDTPASSMDVTTSSLRADYRQLALLVAGVAEGIEHAHRLGVIHRDIKSQNLLLGTDGQLHITDFGLARLLDEPSVTVTGEMLGTPAYMSPEQITADRRKIDHRTDIYSLGVTFYEMLARRRPFEGATRDQIIARICTDEPRSPRKWNPDVPVDLETICLRAMEKDRRRRYQSAGEMAADLRRYAEDRPILSRRVGSVEKAIKWVRRHPARTTIIGLSFVLAIVASVWTVQAVQARHARADALVQMAFDALAYEDYRDPHQARSWLQRAVKLGPDEVPYLETFALAHLLNDPKLAVGHLEQAIARQPDNTEIMYLLAWALRRDQQNHMSGEWIERAKAAGGAKTAAGHFFHAQAVVRNNPEEAVTAYRNASIKRENYAQAWVHLGRAHNHWMYHHRKHERFDEQERFLKMACDMQTGRAYPRYLLSIAYRLSAEIYRHAGNEPDAREHFNKALYYAKEAQAVEPESLRGYVCEAEYWESQKNYPRAIAAWDRGAPYCKTSTTLVELHQYRWRLLYWDGQPTRALEDLRVLKQECPEGNTKRVWFVALFPSLIQAEAGRMDEALQLARLMVDERPNDFRAVTSAACTLRILGQANEADGLLASHAEKIDAQGVSCIKLPPGWVEAMYAFCQRPTTWGSLEQLAADRRNDKLLWPAPNFFAGADALGRGDRQGALDYFRKCERTFDYGDYSYLANTIVRKLEDDPTWPGWLPKTESRTLKSSHSAVGADMPDF